MEINELEKVVRGAAREKDLNFIEEKTLPSEFAQAARTLALRRGKKATAMSLLSPSVAAWI